MSDLMAAIGASDAFMPPSVQIARLKARIETLEAALRRLIAACVDEHYSPSQDEIDAARRAVGGEL